MPVRRSAKLVKCARAHPRQLAIGINPRV